MALPTGQHALMPVDPWSMTEDEEQAFRLRARRRGARVVLIAAVSARVIGLGVVAYVVGQISSEAQPDERCIVTLAGIEARREFGAEIDQGSPTRFDQVTATEAGQGVSLVI